METFAVALAGEEERGWLVEAASAELLVWNERYYRDHFLGGAEMPATWSRL